MFILIEFAVKVKKVTKSSLLLILGYHLEPNENVFFIGHGNIAFVTIL